MNSIIRLNLATVRRFTIATTFGALVALGVAVVALSGSITPAAAAPVGYIPKPDIRDHRTKPVVRDHVNGTVVRDHTGGNVPVAPSKKRGTQCLGNLCHVKVCAASVCF